MRRVRWLLLVTLILGTFVATLRAPLGSAAVPSDPWMAKPVLPILMLTQGEEYELARQQVAEEAGLTADDFDWLLNLAVSEAEQVAALKAESDAVLLDDSLTPAAKQSATKKMNFNPRLSQILVDTNKKVQERLGMAYPAFRDAIRDWWSGERKRVAEKRLPKQSGDVTIQADQFSRDVFATQYAGWTNYEVALPDKYVKWANSGEDTTYPNPPYTVDLYRSSNGSWVNDITVAEVGPWNENDNYWDSSRRLFSDLTLGLPEAEAAYYNDYNGGMDQFGRTVTNPAGIDLTPDVAADLGLGYLQNAWIKVYYYDLP